LHTSNSITDEEGIIFVAKDLEEGEPDFDETEDLQIHKLPLSEALAMVERGEITDAISVAALLRVSRRQKSIKGRSAMPGASAIPGRALWAEPASDARFCFVMECGKLCLCPQPEFQCPSELQ
jgi:hypothetical protein